MSDEKLLKKIMSQSAKKSRKNGIINYTAECFKSLEKCRRCYNYESKCKITIDAFISELENNYY